MKRTDITSRFPIPKEYIVFALSEVHICNPEQGFTPQLELGFISTDLFRPIKQQTPWPLVRKRTIPTE
jgi:hypothetical protein